VAFERGQVREAACYAHRTRVRDLGASLGPGVGKSIALESPTDHRDPDQECGLRDDPIYGLTENNLKGMGRDLRELPKTVIYDPKLSRELPPGLSFVSGLNAIAHAAEGLYAHDGNPVMSLMAEDGIRALATRLRGIENEPKAC
jgi:maleylacetate reductase